MLTHFYGQLNPLLGRSAEHTELVAFGVRHHNPRHIPLTHLGTRCSELGQTGNLRVLVVGSKVEMHRVLRRRSITDRQKQNARKHIWFSLDLKRTRIIVHYDPPERSGPPFTERHRIDGIDDNLFPVQTHDQILESPRSPVPATTIMSSPVTPSRYACFETENARTNQTAVAARKMPPTINR